MTLGKIVGGNVLRLKDERGMTNAELARSSHVSTAVISELCRGMVVDPPSGTLMKVARGLGVPLLAVLEGAHLADEFAGSSLSTPAEGMAQPSAGKTDIRGELADTNDRLERLALAVEKALGRPLEAVATPRAIRRQSPGSPSRLRQRPL